MAAVRSAYGPVNVTSVLVRHLAVPVVRHLVAVAHHQVAAVVPAAPVRLKNTFASVNAKSAITPRNIASAERKSTGPAAVKSVLVHLVVPAVPVAVVRQVAPAAVHLQVAPAVVHLQVAAVVHLPVAHAQAQARVHAQVPVPNRKNASIP